MTPPIQKCWYCEEEYPTPVGLHHTEEECAEAQSRNRQKLKSKAR